MSDFLKEMSDCKITLTSCVWINAKHPHLSDHIAWHWKLEHDGRVFDDGGAASKEVQYAAASAIGKYQDLYQERREERREQRRRINRRAS